ncbi:TonB-dependent receptor [Chitinophaga agrisoli]|nr:TonB-dependent receptor [Chitinophaga agrisoli]
MSRLMFLFLIITLTASGVLVASGLKSQDLKEVKIKINGNGHSVRDLLDDIERQSGFSFYFAEEIGDIKHISLSTKTTSLYEVLEAIATDKRLRFKQSGWMIAVTKMPALPKPPKPGKVYGKVLDEKGGTLPGANIKVIETGAGTQTGVDGNYTLVLAPGTYTLEISYVSYRTRRITSVVVAENGSTSLNISMKLSTNALSEVVVTSSYSKASVEGLYARQKNNAAVSDGITAEQISRTPDNNTAQVLKRVSGLQISDNKYVVVRGLSDRYNNVLLNGAQLPSSEPNRRNFAFDMIPSAILDRIVVNKTATPDLTGEFTGGLVQIETKDIPDSNFYQVTIGTGYNTQSTGKDMFGLDRGKNAWIGFGSEIHKKPAGMDFGEYNGLERSIDRTAPATDPTRQKMHQFLGSMPDNWLLKKYVAAPMQNYQLQLGRVIPFKNESRLGIIAALTYRNEQTIENRDMVSLPFFNYKGTANNYATTLGGSLNLGYRFGKNKITLQNTYNRKFSDVLWKYTGKNIDNADQRVDNYSNVTIINQLFQSQLGGEHVLSKNGIKADWFVSAGSVNRDQPYSRLVARVGGHPLDNLPPDYQTIDLNDNQLRNGNLFYSELTERVYNWAANVRVPFHLLHLSQSLKAGYQGKYRTADFGADLYRMYSFSDAPDFNGLPYDQILNQQNFATYLYLHPLNAGGQNAATAQSAGGYNGAQHLNAFYTMLDLQLLKQLRLIGGMRAEHNDQQVDDGLVKGDDGTLAQKVTTVKQTDWLPSVNAIYALTDKMNVRAAWYKTVARPDFRELSSFAYWDYDLFSMVQGASLQTTNIENVDLRLEYYPSPGEVISLSGFYKNFHNPIEMLIIPSSGGGGTVYYYKNLESALDKGLEVDFRKSLNFIAPSSGFMSHIYLSGNFTWLDANVSFYPNDAVDENKKPIYPKRDRPLAGQSPYIVNGGLLYAGSSFNVNLSYNRYGKRIVFASPDRGEDEYENSRNLLDLQVSYKFLKNKRAELKLNITDLLNQEQIFYKNQFDEGNPLGFDLRLTSVERYPGEGDALLPGQKDPKGTSYNKDYDRVVRRYRFGTTYSMNFIYRF